ncbi:hypothetical protein EN871_34890, partial [bacterium M00.F.Ca.ET.228.01.1.1]
ATTASAPLPSRPTAAAARAFRRPAYPPATHRQAGPIPVSEYMALCLFDPDKGYYTTREPFGAAGLMSVA